MTTFVFTTMSSLMSDLNDTAAIGTVVEAFFYGTLSTLYL